MIEPPGRPPPPPKGGPIDRTPVKPPGDGPEVTRTPDAKKSETGTFGISATSGSGKVIACVRSSALLLDRYDPRKIVPEFTRDRLMVPVT